MCILPVRPPCMALSADPSSNASFVNTMLNAIRQVNKQRGAPQRLNGTKELLMTQTGPVGGNVRRGQRGAVMRPQMRALFTYSCGRAKEEALR